MINREKMLDIPSRVRIIGVPISAVNMNECIEFLMKNWNYLRGNYICVSNVHTTVMAHDNPQYFKVQAESLLSLPDGKPLSVIGKKKLSYNGQSYRSRFDAKNISRVKKSRF